MRAAALALLAAALLAGCGEFPVRDSGPGRPVDLSNVAEPVPRWEPRSRYGNPPQYTVNGHTYKVMDSAEGYVERGLASWYGTKFHGQYTSSREIYDMYRMTAAHRSLPLPTYVRVTNLQNGRSVVVKVNDRGPFHSDRIIDLSYAAAHKLGVVQNGTAMVEVRAIDPAAPTTAPAGSVAMVTPQPAFRAGEIPPPVPVAVPAAADAPPPTTATPSATVTPATAATTHYVQVGAFANRDNAERLRAQLAAREAGALLHETPHATHGTLYLVRVGPLPDAEQAQQLAARLAELGLGTPRVVKESSPAN
jgi:rare lipoprotein A